MSLSAEFMSFMRAICFCGSASAFFVTQTLRALARDGRTVIASIHQPSSEVFELFDQLYLLSGGKTVYFGQASEAYEAIISLFTISFVYFILFFPANVLTCAVVLKKWRFFIIIRNVCSSLHKLDFHALP